nr:reverse transcriptase domain-containing protein [Tanacetum cinerariifolium]
MLLKKLPKKLGDPGKFLIPCDFPGMDVCHALADLGASINLMPLSIWKKLFLPELTPTRMTLKLADRSITRPKGVVEDVFVKVGKFHFLIDFVVVDFKADRRVPLILGRSFLRTGRALIDIYGDEITLRVNDKAVTFNLNQTTRYTYSNDDLSVNQIDIIDVAREEYAEEILGFSSNSSGGSPTLTFEPILSDSSPSLIAFEGSDFILEEIDAYLKDDSISQKINHADCDPERDICLIEKLLNDDPFQLPPMDLKEVIKEKSLIEEPPEVELKDLPSHLEYTYLEENDKLPVIISKDLKDDEKEALLNVLKSHKRVIAWKITDIKKENDKLPVIISKDLKDDEKEALLNVLKSHKRVIAWKITDIKSIDPRFCTHKILMEEDFKPSVQSQRRIDPKIYEVIKKEVLKLLDAGMIYPISDSPWVSPIHCVPKKRGITMVANEENELIPIRLVTGWRLCIDYWKLNEATRKDHFPLPVMDQMLERLAGNEFYCFLDGFSGYFQIRINPQYQEKMTFTCPYGTFAYRRMPFGLCNAPGTFQRCMMAIFHDMIEKTMEVFMDDFLRGIILGHKISKSGLEVDHAKVDVIAKLPHPTTVKGKPFMFSKDCIDAFETLKKKLTEAPILVFPDWKLPFELMCDARDFAIGAVLGQRSENLAADHLSRLENPHKDVSENKDINKKFPLETLGVISSGSNPWFANYENSHAGNFIVKGMSSQQKKKFFKDVKHYFWDDPYLFRIYTRFYLTQHVKWVYVEKHTMEVVSGKGKGVVIKEIVKDDKVNEASETGYRGQSFLLNENDVQTRNIDLTSKVYHPPWSFGSLFDTDISEHPPWSSESMNEKRNKRRSEEFCDNDRSISGLVGDLETWNDDDDLLQQFPFLNDELKENVVGVDAPVVAIKEQLERIEYVVDKEIKRPRKRKRENKYKSASTNVLPFGKLKQ